MPPVERADMIDTAVLWPFTGTYDRYGQPVPTQPVEVDVRWVPSYSEAMDSKGNTVKIEATVIVDDDQATIDSIMWFGTLDDWYAFGSAGVPTNLMQIKTLKRTPDIKGRSHRRELGLMRYKDKI